MNVFLFESEKDLERFLNQIQPSSSAYSYLTLSSASGQLEHILKTRQIGPVAVNHAFVKERDELLKAYVNMIGEVNHQQHSRLWWATDLSSKNRFMNRLPDYMKDLLDIKALTENPNQQPVLVFPVPWPLRKTVETFLKKKNIACQYQRAPLKTFVAKGVRRLRDMVGLLYHAIRSIFRWGWCRWQLHKKIEAQLKNLTPSYVIKCFLYPHSFSKETGEYRDIFYNQLPHFLKRQGQEVVFFANLLGDFFKDVKGIKACSGAVIIPLEYTMTFVDILMAYLQMAFYRPKPLSKIVFADMDVTDLLSAENAWGAGKIQPYQYLHYIQTQRLVERLSPSVFLMTYENNPWEKMCTLAIREHRPQTKILAYQHTVNPQASVNMFHSRQEEAFAPIPDRVLAIGEVSKQVIERYTQSSKPQIEPTCALQFEHLWKLSAYPRTKTRTILLGLEGIFDVYKMINYVLNQLKPSQKYKVIIRAHPVLPVKAMAHRIDAGLLDLPWVEVSQGVTLLKDIERSDLMVYWGSMAALEAQWMGKPLVHFDMQTLFSYDALFDSGYFKWIVTPHTPLIPVLEQIYSLSDEQFLSEQEKAKQYLKQYFAQVTPEKLNKFL